MARPLHSTFEVLHTTSQHRCTMCRRLMLAAALAFSLSARSSFADEPSRPASSANLEQSRESAGLVSLGVLAGWNHGDEVGAGGPRTLFGYGGRLGYSFATTPLYLGFTVVQYTHQIDDLEDPEQPDVTHATEHHVHANIDIGADIAAGPFTVRPYIGLGTWLGIFDNGPNSNSGVRPELVPGVHIKYPIGPLHVGADARFELGWGNSAALLGGVGAQL